MKYILSLVLLVNTAYGADTATEQNYGFEIKGNMPYTGFITINKTIDGIKVNDVELSTSGHQLNKGQRFNITTGQSLVPEKDLVGAIITLPTGNGDQEKAILSFEKNQNCRLELKVDQPSNLSIIRNYKNWGNYFDKSIRYIKDYFNFFGKDVVNTTKIATQVNIPATQEHVKDKLQQVAEDEKEEPGSNPSSRSYNSVESGASTTE